MEEVLWEARPGEAQRYIGWKARYREAQRRVGETAEQRLRWLVDFGQEDVQTLSRGRAIDLDDEIRAFSATGVPTPDLGHQAVGLPLEVLEDEGDRVRKLQQQWRDALQQLVERGVFFYQATANYALGRHLDGMIEYTINAPREPAFFLAIFRLIAQQGARIRQCAADDCTRIFVGPLRQTFCGSRCAQRMRTNRFRKKKHADKKHADKVSEKRHEAYVRKVQAKHPKAKVGRRKRKR
jgi:hypothetical protein